MRDGGKSFSVCLCHSLDRLLTLAKVGKKKLEPGFHFKVFDGFYNWSSASSTHLHHLSYLKDSLLILGLPVAFIFL